MSIANPERIALARRLRGLTKQALAAQADLSPRSLTDFENGHQTPSPSSLSRLAAAVGMPQQFFCLGPVTDISAGAVSFRALTRMTARQRDQALSSAIVAFELSAWIDLRFRLPDVAIPEYPHVDPEVAADAVRAAWQLGEGPISNMVHLLEAHGVRVYSLIEECHEIDAFSLWTNGIPFVFLNTTKSAEHSRMDAAHELGHLVLHRDPTTRLRDRAAEQEAQRFASAFLMPRRSVLANAPRRAAIADLIKAKRHWRASLASLVYRMHQLRLISDWQYRSLFIEMSARGYLKHEPAGISQESSKVLSKILELLRSRDQTRADIAEDLHVPLEILNKLIFGLAFTTVDGRAAGATDKRGRRPDLRVVDPNP